MSKYGVFSCPLFLVFGLNTETYSVILRIQSEYRKIRTGKYSIFEHFSRSDIVVIQMSKYQQTLHLRLGPNQSFRDLLMSRKTILVSGIWLSGSRCENLMLLRFYFTVFMLLQCFNCVRCWDFKIFMSSCVIPFYEHNVQIQIVLWAKNFKNYIYECHII